MSEGPETENLPESPQEKVTRAYRRAGVGLALGAIGWTLALLFAKEQDENPMRWMIPIAAAAISVICFARYRNSQNRDQ